MNLLCDSYHHFPSKVIYCIYQFLLCFCMLFVYVNKDILGVLMLKIWVKDLKCITRPYISVCEYIYA